MFPKPKPPLSERTVSAGRAYSQNGNEFSSSQVAAITGASLRQLQWWDEKGIVSAHIDGHNRVWDTRTVLRAALILELRRRGVTLHRIKRAIAIRMPDTIGPVCYMVSDGHGFKIKTSADAVLDLLSTTRQPSVLVDLAELNDKIQNRIRNGRAA